MKLKSLGLGLLLAAAVIPFVRASNSIVFTVTATADSYGYGYIQGQSYTFIYTTGSSYTNTGSNAFGGSSNFWDEEQVGDDRMFAKIEGTGLTGTFTDPAPDTSSPYSFISTNSSNYLELFAGNNSVISIGLLAADGTTDLGNIDASINFGGALTFSYTGYYTDPNVYFADYSGDYTASGGVSSSLTSFSVTNVSISSVPEPSTYAALAGLAALSFCAYRRRARR